MLLKALPGEAVAWDECAGVGLSWSQLLVANTTRYQCAARSHLWLLLKMSHARVLPLLRAPGLQPVGTLPVTARGQPVQAPSRGALGAPPPKEMENWPLEQRTNRKRGEGDLW